MARKRMGEMLAREDTVKADIVIAVPDSGNSAALGYSAQSGIPLEQGLTRNHYMGRTFIQPTTAMRESGVRMKLHPIREAIDGKRVVVIDDSLVRGTTSRQIVKLLREAGRSRSASASVLPTATLSLLLRHRHTHARRADLQSAGRRKASPARSRPTPSCSCPWKRFVAAYPNPDDFCYACFNGAYPSPVKDAPISRKR